ncbi:MAG: DUF5040 domain-containing protein [Dysgonomonas sp.]
MKRLFFYFILFTFGTIVVKSQSSQTVKPESQNEKYTILLTGASFASPNNGWFEIGCRNLGAKAINRAIGGEAIANTANKMTNGTLYSKAELEDIDALVIMQVHDKDVASEEGLQVNYEDYKTPFDRSNYAAAYDYVIKRYITECYNLKFDKDSKYYNSPNGKPAAIVLCTHWHDARTIFNPAIRKLAEKWGFPVVEFDKYIGFSKDHLHPVTGKQWSILFTDNNTETINGEIFGWHPQSGQDKYIQQRMGAIFTDLMKKVLPLR